MLKFSCYAGVNDALPLSRWIVRNGHKLQFRPGGAVYFADSDLLLSKRHPAIPTLLKCIDLIDDLYRISKVTFSIDGDRLIANMGELRAFMNNPCDIKTLHEMFAVQLYRFHLPGDLIFVDVGMNIGLASLYFHSTHQGHSYGFELVPDTFRAAKLNFELNLKASTKHTAYPYGLLDRDAEFSVTVDTQNSAGNSIFKESKGSPAQVSVEVNDAAVAIGKIFEAHPDSTFILKLDAEGAEFEILDRLSEQGLLGRFSLLLLELHQRDDRNSDEIRSLLRNSHFSWNESNIPLHNCGLMCAYPVGRVSQDRLPWRLKTATER